MAAAAMSAAGLLLAGYAVVGGPTSSFAGVVTYSGAMEGNIGFAPGSWVSAGYHFSGGTVGTPITFENAEVTLPVACSPGGPAVGTIVVPLANGPYTPTGSGDVPWQGQSTSGPATFQGAVQAPNLCKGGEMYNSAAEGGASFSANVVSQSSAPIQLQFHYSVPSAKNNANTNCSSSSDPNARGASICGAPQSCCFTICPHQPPSPPTTKPSPPTTKPSPPTTWPSPPTTKPSPPTTWPSPPTTKPSPPTTWPSPPTTKPSPPTTWPSPPTTKPSPPTTWPSPPTTQPSQPTTGSLAGHIYLCQSGAQTTTEVPGGTLAASGPQNVASTSNPLGPVQVKAGDYTMSALAPSGYTFVTCDSTATIGSSATTATESVTVPVNGLGTGTFYVDPIPITAPQSVSLMVVKANDANGSGIYSQTETAPQAGADVPFEVLVTNTSSQSVIVTSLTDEWPGQAPFSPSCAAAVQGTTLAPGATATCDFTVAHYAPPSGKSLTDKTTAIVCQANDTDNCASASAVSTVNTATAPTAPVTAAAKGSLAFTGPPSHMQFMLVLGLGTASVGFFFLWFARPRRKTAPPS